jgi:hypothetical protein
VFDSQEFADRATVTLRSRRSARPWPKCLSSTAKGTNDSLAAKLPSDAASLLVDAGGDPPWYTKGYGIFQETP